MQWSEYLAAFAMFFLTHSLPLRPFVRTRVEAALGRRTFTLGYSLVSLAALAWLIGAAGRAPYVGLWTRAEWQTWVPLIAMSPVCLIVVFALGRPNPLSFGGSRDSRFDPRHPGIVRWTRHPLLLALALWATAHLVPNGDLAHALLFSVFAAFAVFGMTIVDRRKRRAMGHQLWQTIVDKVRAAPVLPPPASWSGLIARLAVATLLYGLMLAAHSLLIGVSPLP